MMDTYKIVYAIKKKDQPIEVLDKFVIADTPQMAISEFNKTMKEEPCYTIISVYFLLDTLPAKEKVDNDVIVCHTNLKENAELIAKILDADTRGEIFLDKIRAEVMKLDDINPDYPMDRTIHISRNEVLRIIDKYKKSEGEE